ncbi:hypothetical protein FA15DRAFT_116162 [Coprinopsis marcescibilis]|uniref:Uncharacterized protein n=1 Tax=Coprinopsis marcescibilis TaxID=230819 RepID=A0A5C3KXG4_COPMA|nr:hypothetical protein FA15DRAFT_116162 [Coprinopsis marcescibilis]
MLLGPHHDPSQGMQHNYARHYDQIYSPYGRAYDAHQHLMQPTSLTMPPYSAGGSSFEQGRMSSISPVEMDTNLGMLTETNGEYSTINFPSSGDPSSSLRTSRSASHGNSSYSYLDPSLLQNLRFTETPELRPRSHSPTSVLRQPGGIPQASHRVSGRVQSMFSNSTSVRSAAHLNLPASGHFRSHSSSVSPASGQYAVSNPDSDSSRDNGRPTSENRHLY